MEITLKELTDVLEKDQLESEKLKLEKYSEGLDLYQLLDTGSLFLVFENFRFLVI